MTRTDLRCAFLTMSDPVGFVIDDGHAVGPLKHQGWSVQAVPWDHERADWSEFDAVVLRSTWDYQHRPERFLSVVADIENSGVPLFNSGDLVRWNVRKTYLRDLAADGIPIVPTLFLDRLQLDGIDDLFGRLESNEIVLKPLVSASAEATFRLQAGTWRQQQAALTTELSGKAALAQPFVRAVPDGGELSLFYFDGAFSHAVRKTPAPGDFRVQEEHGAEIATVVPTEAVLQAGRRAMGAVPGVPLYARVDLVPANEAAGHWLMELELIEPSLYLRMDPEAPRRFAEAFVRQMDRRRPVTRRAT